jgi:hypothetical protein
MKKIYLFAFLFVEISAVFSQKMLLLEKSTRTKSERIYLGQSFHFKLKNQSGWYERTITDILPNEKMILLDLEPVKIDDILAISRPRSGFVRALGQSLTIFPATILLMWTVSAASRDKPSSIWLGIAATSFVSGRIMLRKKKLKMGKKWRLRALEI